MTESFPSFRDNGHCAADNSPVTESVRLRTEVIFENVCSDSRHKRVYEDTSNKFQASAPDSIPQDSHTSAIINHNAAILCEQASVPGNGINGTEVSLREKRCDSWASHKMPLASEKRTPVACGKKQTKTLLITDLDAVDDDDNDPSYAAPSINRLISQDSSHQKFRDDIIWEFSGLKLSNVCQKLVKDCDKFTEKLELLSDETSIRGNPKQQSPQSENITRLLNCTQTNSSKRRSQEYEFGCYERQQTRSLKGTGAESSTASIKDSLPTNLRSFENSRLSDILASIEPSMINNSVSQVCIPGNGELFSGDDKFSSGRWSLPVSPILSTTKDVEDKLTPVEQKLISVGQKLKSTCLQSNAQSISFSDKKIENYDWHSNFGQQQSETVGKVTEKLTAINGNNSKLMIRNDETSQHNQLEKDANQGRLTNNQRGRTKERGRYDSGFLKDFIRPENRKFSLPPSEDIDIRTWEMEEELAIWEPTDFVKDRHQSAPPDEGRPMTIAKSDDMLLQRSRKGSISPQRQRILGSTPRWIRGAKSAEILTSRNASPSGVRIRRRALSKEWQIVTFTTREEITTLIKPKARSDVRDMCTEEADNRRSSFVKTEDVSGNCSAKDTKSTREQSTLSGNSRMLQVEVEKSIHSVDSLKTPNRKIKDDLQMGIETALHLDTENTLHMTYVDTVKTNFEKPLDASMEISQNTVHIGVRDGQEDEIRNSSPSTNLLHATYGERKAAPDNNFTSAVVEMNSFGQKHLPVSSGTSVTEDHSELWCIISETLMEMERHLKQTDPPPSSTTFKNNTGINCVSDVNRVSEIQTGNDLFSGPATLFESDGIVFGDDSLKQATTGMEMDELVRALLDFAHDGDTVHDLSSAERAGISSSTATHSDGSANETRNKQAHLQTKSFNELTDNFAKSENTEPPTFLVASSRENFCEEIATKSLDAGSHETATNHVSIRTPFDSEKNHLRNSLKDELDELITCLPTISDDFVSGNESSGQISDLKIEEERDYNCDAQQYGHSLSPQSVHKLPCNSCVPEEAAGGNDVLRQRATSKKDNSSAAERALLGSRTESDDVFHEKAFLESLFSSIGTIIFLLLAAFIFHVFSRIVEHEL